MPGSLRGGPGAVLRRTRSVLRGEVAARNRWLLDAGLRSAQTRGSPYVLASSTTTSARTRDRKSTRLNSSHLVISYAVFCLKKKKLFFSNLLLLSLAEPTSQYSPPC